MVPYKGYDGRAQKRPFELTTQENDLKGRKTPEGRGRSNAEKMGASLRPWGVTQP